MATNNPLGHKNNVLSPPICRDFLNGRCFRTNCSYQHKTKLMPAKPLQNQLTHEDQTNTKQYHQIITQPIVSHMFIPKKGGCLISFTNFIQQTAFNGLFICNLADIIPPSIISRLLKSSDSNIESVCDQISVLAEEWADKLQKIIRWTQQSTPEFDKQNFGLVFIFDISSVISDWLSKLCYTHKKINESITNSKTKQHNFTPKIIDSINQLFTILFSQTSAQESVGYPLSNINILVNYMVDELNLINKGCLEMLIEMITLSPNKYISTQFYYNIYYIGLPPSLDMPLSSPENKGFIFSYITGSKFINLAMIYTTKPSEITFLADIDIGMNITGYITELATHNNKVYQTLFQKTDKLKSALINSIPTHNYRPKSLVIIGCNLDMDFDKQILTGLKEVVGSIDFTHCHPNKPTVGNTKSDTTNQSSKKKEDCCNGDDSSSTSFTMSIILPIVNNSATNSGQSTNGASNQLNEMMRELLGGRATGSTTNSVITSTKIVQNRVCTIGLNIIHSTDGQLILNQPLQTVAGIEKIKEYGQTPDNRIIIICSARLSHSLFQDIINQITKLPEYPNKISANFIDFNINPSVRGCLAYHNYRTQVQNNYGDMGKMMGTNDYSLIRNIKLWRRLNSYILDIKPSQQREPSASMNVKYENSNPNSRAKSESNAECCQCCSCISRHGVGYVKFGHLPYIPKTLLDGITDDSWLPRF